MFALFRALPVLWQLGIALALIATIAGGYYAWRSSIFNDGLAEGRAEQVERDNEAVHDAGSTIRNVDACHDAGGVWSQSRSVCDR